MGANSTTSREDAIATVKRLREHGHVAYFAGGCVRDILLNLEPKDYDIATDAPPQRVRELFSNTQAVGAAFGVILVRYGKSTIEVATFRTDVSYEDGRRPTAVKFTTAEEDAKRRDFTINGLFFDPIENKVIDYVGGQEDLAAKRLRAIGEPNERFHEDHLRLLRAVRFASRFQLSFDPVTLAAIAAHAQHLKRISPERIAEELRLMLTPPTRSNAWGSLWSFGLLDVIFRTLTEVGPPRPLFHMRSIFRWIEPLQGSIDFGLALAAGVFCYRWQRGGMPDDARPLLNRKLIRSDVAGLRQTLKISNEESETFERALVGVGEILNGEATLAARKRFLANPTASASIELMRAMGNRIGLHSQIIQPLLTGLERLAKTNYAPSPLITGDDLAAAGLQPGPLFKRILDAVYDGQLEDRIKTKEGAMQLAMELAKR